MKENNYQIEFERFNIVTSVAKFLFEEASYKYYLFSIFLSVLAWYFTEPLFHSLFLLEVLFHADLLLYVLRSLTEHSTQILMTLLLMTIFIYIFAFIGFEHLFYMFWMSAVPDNGENLCSDLWHCFLTIFSLGPRSSGGIGDQILKQPYSNIITDQMNNAYLFTWVYN